MDLRSLARRFGIRLVIAYVLLVLPWPGLNSTVAAAYRHSLNGLIRLISLQDHLHLGPPVDAQPGEDMQLASTNPRTGERIRIAFKSRDWAYLPLAAGWAMIIAVPAPWPRRLRAWVYLTLLLLAFIAARTALAAAYGLGAVAAWEVRPSTLKVVGSLMVGFSATPVTSYVVPVILWLLVMGLTYELPATATDEKPPPDVAKV